MAAQVTCTYKAMYPSVIRPLLSQRPATTVLNPWAWVAGYEAHPSLLGFSSPLRTQAKQVRSAVLGPCQLGLWSWELHWSKSRLQRVRERENWKWGSVYQPPTSTPFSPLLLKPALGLPKRNIIINVHLQPHEVIFQSLKYGYYQILSLSLSFAHTHTHTHSHRVLVHSDL